MIVLSMGSMSLLIYQVMYGESYVLRNPSTELYFAVKSAAGSTDKNDSPAPTAFPVATTEAPSDGYWFLRGRAGAEKGPVKQEDEVILRWRSSSVQPPDSGKDQILNIFHETGWAGLLKTTDKTKTLEESTLLFRWKDIWDKSKT